MWQDGISHKQDTLFGTGVTAMRSMTICLWEWTRVGAEKGQDQWALAVANGEQSFPCCWLEEALCLTPQWIRQQSPDLLLYDTTYCTHSIFLPTHRPQSSITPNMQAELNYYTPANHTHSTSKSHTYKSTHSACNYILYQDSVHKMDRFNTYNHANLSDLPLPPP